MDAERFDGLTRWISSGISRRRALQSLAASSVALAFAPKTNAQCINPDTCQFDDDCCEGAGCDLLTNSCIDELPEPCVLPGDSCGEQSVCCVGICSDNICQCTPAGSECADSVECCDFNLCVDGTCTTCLEDGASCSESWECCLSDCLNGVCAVCVETGAACLVPIDCCNGQCQNGVCVEGCGIPFDVCSDDDDCCSGYPCGDNGECQACLIAGFPCSADADCCTSMCQGGMCASCLEVGGACFANSHCCTNSCYEGVCATCHQEGEFCGEGGCCSGSCYPTGHSTVCWGCLATGRACSDHEECCSGQCEGAVCGRIPCYPGMTCPLGEYCFDGFCTPYCDGDADCGVGAICCGNTCQHGDCCISVEHPDYRCDEGMQCIDGLCMGVACAGNGEPCADSADCCSGLECSGGTCVMSDEETNPPDDDDEEVQQLPNTGSGHRKSSDSIGLTGALAAIGAALWGRNRISHTRSDSEVEID